MFTMSNALETDDRTSLIIVGTRELEITHNKKITKEIRKEKAIEYSVCELWTVAWDDENVRTSTIECWDISSAQ